MGLQPYRAKRDFERTREPRGTVQASKGPLRFFVQRHAATRLHFDFRLELDGVLKSWAVPKGPSLDPAERRLAVAVEDHPIEYGSFEGAIPKGQYGAGSVLLWDRGSWEPVGDPHEGLKAGHLKFSLAGEKLKGAWSLVRLRDGDDWLLIKARDAAAAHEDITALRPESVGAPEPSASRVEPQLATLVTRPPTGEGWIYEVKLDGYRVLAHLDRGRCRLFTRGGQDWTSRWPRIAGALERLPVNHAVIDGEIVVLDARGVSHFAGLVDALGKRDDSAMVYFAFDLIDGEAPVAGLPLLDRKARLQELLAAARGPIRFLEHLEGDGGALLASMCRLGLEGMIAKRGDRPHRGGRGRDWLKLKCTNREELVILGWTEPRGGREGFGALLLGTRRNGPLTYAGKVGTGFSASRIAALMKRFAPIARETPPVPRPTEVKEVVHWLEPALVAEITHAGWTPGERLWHPVFAGLREDKPANAVVAELPDDGEASRPVRRRGKLMITHPERVIDAASGVTKGQLADWYSAIAPRLLPELAGRPLSVVRCPDGLVKACFFQKHVTPGFPSAVHALPIGDGAGDTISIRDTDGLLGLVQFGVIEFHPWGSRGDDIERPDRLVFDLDPDPALPWGAVVEGARHVRELLRALKLAAYVRVTGGKGLHVVVPIQRRHDWAAVKPFTRGIAQALVQAEPGKYTAAAGKAERSGRIYVDYLRNGRGATAIASWSARARPGLPVCVPVAWEELDDLDGGNTFTLERALARPDIPVPRAQVLPGAA